MKQNKKSYITPNYVSFDNTLSKKKNWVQRLFNIQSPLARSGFRFLKIVLEFVVISWIVVTITFFLINSIPGNTGVEDGISEGAKATIRAQLGLDQPLGVRYINYISGLLRGDLGISLSVFKFEPINSFIWDRLFKSLYVGLWSVCLTVAIGVPVGVIVGKNPDGILDNATTILISIFSSIPSLIFAVLLLIIGRELNMPYIFDFRDFATYMLPGIALSLGSIIVYIKYIKTELNRELNSMHSKFCYLKGLTRSRFVWTHALKPSLFPIATFFPGVVLGSFVGSIFIERIFLITGSGNILYNAITSKDYNIILFQVIFFSLLTILSYTLRDVLYEIIDPRIRRKGGR
ncbi:ABC transporter permease [Mycoplasmopsis ciconiae]|uniref:ABC transporter permease n=1 Tax=Mycoplasmopsis ciconiae TaxID=561067 RepID=A0ABU7MM09_9BACT|nr:ABC transporter permease [Mycoplasmopsis ciconiae]